VLASISVLIRCIINLSQVYKCERAGQNARAAERRIRAFKPCD